MIAPAWLAMADARASRRQAGDVADANQPVWPADAMTINPYLGRDAVEPFLKAARTDDRGLFVLVRTSNAGAGLFITRCIAKGTGGYFGLVSGAAAFRQRRSRSNEDEITLYPDPLEDPRHDMYNLASGWHGTVVAMEIRTDRIADYGGFFQWIFKQIPSRKTKGKINFT